MFTKTDKGRSVVPTSKKSLSLLLAIAFAVAGFLIPATVRADINTPIVAVSLLDRTPLEAVPVEAEEIAEPDSYVNDYFGFTRSDLVEYLVEHAEEYLGTPYTYDSYANPTPGPDGGMQCEGFVWSAMFHVAKVNRGDVPCGTAQTEPLGNGGGWVDWAYYHGIEPLTFTSKEEMLSSGVLEKGDIIWSFDAAGPYGISSYNHVGFFWGDTPNDDKFWHSGQKTSGVVLAGDAEGNRITRVQGLVETPSVWWVFKLSPDADYKPGEWAGKPATTSGQVRTTGNAAAAAAGEVKKEIVFYGG